MATIMSRLSRPAMLTGLPEPGGGRYLKEGVGASEVKGRIKTPRRLT